MQFEMARNTTARSLQEAENLLSSVDTEGAANSRGQLKRLGQDSKTERSAEIGANSGAISTIPIDVLSIVELGEKRIPARQTAVVDDAERWGRPDRPLR